MPRGFVDVQGLVDHVLTKTGSPRRPNGYAVDIEAMLRNYCHFDIAQVPLLSIRGIRLSGMIIPDRMLVLIDAGEPERRQRFTLAHELGHAQIDFPSATGDPSLLPVPSARAFRCVPSDVRDREPQTEGKRREVLANMFAARVLMPKTLIHEAWRATQDVGQCANLLEVSTEAARYRLRELQLI